MQIIAHLSDIPMFYIQYLSMHKVHMHAGTIMQLLYGCAYVREIIHSLKLVDYLSVHTHKPYNNLHVNCPKTQNDVMDSFVKILTK